MKEGGEQNRSKKVNTKAKGILFSELRRSSQVDEKKVKYSGLEK